MTPFARATRNELQRQIQDGDYQLLHLSGHAGFDNGRAFLQLRPAAGEDTHGRVYADDLGAWTRNSDLRFVFLNVCTGVLPDAGQRPVLNQYRTLCSELLEAGVPEVIAHMWPVADDEGYPLAIHFYDAYMSNEFDAARALMLARRSRNRTKEAVWGAPILVSQARVQEQRLSVLEERVGG
jgi:CHAT domain-containing protein